MANFLTRIFGSRNQRLLRQYTTAVNKTNAMEEGVQALDDAGLRAKTAEFKQRYADGESLASLLAEAFAVVREASMRTLQMRPFDVQLIGGMVLHEGNIAEMRTGEGKTLMSTLPAYLNSISGDGVHIVTVNEYLAQRDADWMRPIYEFLGLTVGVSRSGQTQDEKRAAYQCDITYATNNELGFDYLRDNLAFTTADKVQRDLNFAIVDEVDSILIDEARTPLIISGPTESSTDLYSKINKLIPKLKPHEETDEPTNFDIPASTVTLVDQNGSSVPSDDALCEVFIHEGNIAEMRTGEGKTLMSTLPAYLNSISGDGVHIVTVNEYLAQRDADWMRPIYEFLGLTVGVSRSGQTQDEKRAAYQCDITYATNNELGFDYLRDNLAFTTADKVQRDLNFAIVDEVDSILIDEARTPLIISGPTESSTDLYSKINKLIPKLKPHEETDEPTNFDIPASTVTLVDQNGSSVLSNDADSTTDMTLVEAIEIAEQREADVVMIELKGKVAACRLISRGDYTVDEKAKQAHVTEEGHLRVEALMSEAGLLAKGESLYDAGNIKLLHHLSAALRAHAIYQHDVDYIVKDKEVVIVDEFTGRTMPGRRWGDGLHQAVEAKEGVSRPYICWNSNASVSAVPVMPDKLLYKRSRLM